MKDQYLEKAIEVMSINGVICPQDIAAALREAAAEAYEDAANVAEGYEVMGLALPVTREVKAILRSKAAALRKSGE